MGNGPSVLNRCLEIPPVRSTGEEPAKESSKEALKEAPKEQEAFTITLEDVSRLHNCYRDGYYDFGLTEEAIHQLLVEASWKKQVTAKKLFEVFDPETAGLVNALEMLATLAAISSGSVSDKATLIFHIFDLQAQGELTYDELVVLFICTLSGLVKVVRPNNGIRYPEDSEMENVADQVFLSADRDVGGNVGLPSFNIWIQKTFSQMKVKELKVIDLLAYFGLLSQEISSGEEGGHAASEDKPLFADQSPGVTLFPLCHAPSLTYANTFYAVQKCQALSM